MNKNNSRFPKNSPFLLPALWTHLFWSPLFFASLLFVSAPSWASISNLEASLCEDIFLGHGLSVRFSQMHLPMVLDFLHQRHLDKAEQLMENRQAIFTIPSVGKVQLTPKSLQHILFGEFKIEKSLQPHVNSLGTLRLEQTDSIVLKGGLHSYEGLKTFDVLRDLTRTPLDMYIANENLYTSKGRDTRALVFNQDGVHEVSLPRIALYRFPETRALAVGFPKQSVAHQVFLEQFTNGSLHLKNRAQIDKSEELQKTSTIYGYFRQNFTKLLFPAEMSLETITQILFFTLESPKTEWTKKTDGYEGKIKIPLPTSHQLTAKVFVDQQGQVKSFYPVEDLLKPFTYLSKNTHSADTDKSTPSAKIEDFVSNISMIKLYFSRPSFLEKFGRKEQINHLTRATLTMLSDAIRENLRGFTLDQMKGDSPLPKSLRKDLDKMASKTLKANPHGILPQKVVMELAAWLFQNMRYTTMIPDEYAQMLTTRMLQEIDSRHWEQP